MPLIEIRMPADENEGTQAALGRWLKQPGEAVAEHEPIVEINTDKVTIEIPATASGVIASHAKSAGDFVIAGDLLGTITSASSSIAPATSKPAAATAETSTQVVQASPVGEGGFSPATRRLLAELNLDPAAITKTGRGNRLTPGDIAAHVASTAPATSDALPGAPPAAITGKLVPHTPMRRSIAAHMARSMATAPHVTAVFEADLFNIIADRATKKASGSDAPSVTAYLLHAALEAVRIVPEVNSKWHADNLELFDHVHLGVATALGTGGLVVPVIRDANRMDLAGLSAALRALTTKARDGKLTQADLEGGTFTLSNHGVSGSLLATPIVLPHGQAAILGAGKVQKRVIVCETGGRELFRIRPMMYVTLTIDHRVLDGQHANAYMTAFVEALERPRSD